MKVLVLSLGSFVSAFVARRLIGDGHAVCELDVREIVRGSMGVPSARFLLNALTSLWGADRRRDAGAASFQGVVYVHEPPRVDLADVRPSRTGLSVHDDVGLSAALEFATAHGARFVLASVWGRRSEDHSATLAAESIVSRFSVERDALVAMARLEDVYGPTMPLTRDFSLVGALVQAAVEHRPFEVMTPTGQALDEVHWPVHVRDAVDGVVRLLYRGAPSAIGPVTFGGATPYRIRELIAGISHVVQAEVPVTVGCADDLPSTSQPPMVGVARRALGWRPRTGLHAGLEDVAHNDPRWRIPQG